MATMYVAVEKYILMDVGIEVNLALTALTLSKYIVKRAIPHCRRSEVF